MVDEASCPSCGLEAETILHRWWRCPALGAARHQAQVEDLARIGAARDYQPKCFWQNGLVLVAAVAVMGCMPWLAQIVVAAA